MNSYNKAGKITKSHFKVSIENGDQKRKVYTDESGKILNRIKKIQS